MSLQLKLKVKLKIIKLLIVLLPQKKILSTIAILSISGLMATLFLISNEPSNSQTKASEMTQIGIPESLQTMIVGSIESFQSENIQKENKGLNSCTMASILIGKNGIAKCAP